MFRKEGYSGDSLPGEDTIKVFPSEYWEEVKLQFDKTISSGFTGYFHIKLPVLENKNNGIEGGYTVELLVIILNKSTIFSENLPISNIDSLFPNYPTGLTNEGDILALTKEQINLLSTFTEWNIMDNIELRNIIINMFHKNFPMNEQHQYMVKC